MRIKKLFIGSLLLFCFTFLFLGFSNVNAVENNIKLDKAKIIKVSPKKKSIKLSWKKVNNATGYQVAYKKNKTKKYSYKNTKSLSIKINKLKAGTKYKVRVRAYTENNKKKVYSPWSKTKKVSTKSNKKSSTTSNRTAKKRSSKKKTKSSSVNSSRKVYVTSTGTRYHSHAGCKGLTRAKSIFSTSLTDAVASGKTKCHICW